MDELARMISATSRERRVPLTQGPDSVRRARLRVASVRRLAVPRLCESRAPWGARRGRAVASVAPEDIVFALGFSDGRGGTRATPLDAVEPPLGEPPGRARRLSSLGGDFRRAKRLPRSFGR